jgi:uncharacterized protein (TIGR02452 family)
VEDNDMGDRTNTTVVCNIVNSKSMKVNGKNVDLTAQLDRSNRESKEYRQKELKEIDISGFKQNEENCKIVIRSYDSPDAIRENAGKTAILNFASSKNPGGGFETGAMAQEESLCYRSNLYFDLKEHMPFYEFNRANLKKSIYTDGLIYSSDICFFRDAKAVNCEPYYLDVITIAAPNFRAARRHQVPVEEINETMRRRIEYVFRVAVEHKVEHLVLGAFGCGVFGNDPSIVANYMYEMIFDKGYGKYFKQITFAMHDSVSENTKAFVRTFNRRR